MIIENSIPFPIVCVYMCVCFKLNSHHYLTVQVRSVNSHFVRADIRQWK